VGGGGVAGVGGAGGRAGAGGGGGAGGGRSQGRRGAPTRFLTVLYDMLVAGNPQIWWERETGSVVIEDPQLFEAETMPLHFSEPKMSLFLRQLSCYGFKKPGKGLREQGRYRHPECHWKDVSCIKSLLSKKVYDQKRLEKAIRNSSAVAGASSADDGPCGNGGGGGVGGSVDPGTRGGSSSTGLMMEGEDSDGAEVVEVERTELEIATEAAVVRGKGVSRQARKELRQSMTRSQLGRWQMEQTAKLMMEVMRLNSKLVKGLKECRARGGPPRIRRCRVNSPAVAKIRLEHARLRRRVRQLEDEVANRGLPVLP
ncbi:unnamed protein product, partial [Hapterophycus canaliculatus]